MRIDNTLKFKILLVNLVKPIVIIAIVVGCSVVASLGVLVLGNEFEIPYAKVDADSTISKLVNIARTTQAKGGDVEKAVDEFMETSEYKNTCRSLYQKFVEFRKAPHYGDAPEFVNQLSGLGCLETMEKWK
mgnify:CR=1 FL=1